eukprot:5110268-Prymnesium_polylepis.1
MAAVRAAPCGTKPSAHRPDRVRLARASVRERDRASTNANACSKLLAVKERPSCPVVYMGLRGTVPPGR